MRESPSPTTTLSQVGACARDAAEADFYTIEVVHVRRLAPVHTWGRASLRFLVTVLTLGICTPFAIVLRQWWRAKHTYINGHRLVFGLRIQWLLLMVVTVDIYSLWVVPRVQKWIVENTDFDPTLLAPVPQRPSPAVNG